MKLVHILSGIILFIVLTAAGAGLMYIAWQGPEYWAQALDLAKNFRKTGFIAGVGVLAMLFFYLVTFIRPRSKEQFLTFKSDDGTVNISMDAAKNFIERIGEEFAAVVGLRVFLRAHNGVPAITLNMRVKAGTQIPELCQMMQSRIRETLYSHLGISKIRNIEINIKEITGAIPPTTGDAEGEEVMREAGYEV